MHLLFPLFSSIVFVLGMMLAKKAIDAGASPWTGTFLANIWLAVFWAGIAVVRGDILPVAAWTQAAAVAGLFVLGQLFTYLAFQHGDVSVAAPIFGIKVLMVAVLTAALFGEQIPGRVWLGGLLAAMGVVLIQSSQYRAHAAKKKPRWNRKALLTIFLALTAAFALSLFDVCMQTWGPRWDSYAFLPMMFGTAGILSFIFLPWVDKPQHLKTLNVQGWMIAGTLLMALQAMSMCFSLSTFGDATRINIVYSLRGLWAVVLAWLLGRFLQSAEGNLGYAIMLRRLTGAGLLTAAVVMAILS